MLDLGQHKPVKNHTLFISCDWFTVCNMYYTDVYDIEVHYIEEYYTDVYDIEMYAVDVHWRTWIETV